MRKTTKGQIKLQLLSTESKLLQQPPYQNSLKKDSSNNIYFLADSIYYNSEPTAGQLPTLFKINTSGVLDSTFKTNTGVQAAGITAFDIDPTNGDIIVVGTFTTWNGVACPAGIIKLNSDGTLDTTFNTNVGIGVLNRQKSYNYTQVSGMTTDVFIEADTYGPDGDNILLVGDGSTDIDGLIAAWNLANPSNTCSLITGDGSQVPDNLEEIPLFEGYDEAAAQLKVSIDSNGKALIMGIFGSINNTVAFRGLARLNQNGTLDSTFNNALGYAFNFVGNSNKATDAVTLSDGSIVIGGRWFSDGFGFGPNFTGNGVQNIVVLNSDASQNTTFLTNAVVGYDDYGFLLNKDSSDNIYLSGYGQFADGLYFSNGLPMKMTKNGVVDVAFFNAINATGPGLLNGDQIYGISIEGTDIVMVGYFSTGFIPDTVGSFTGQVPGMTTDVTITNDYAGESFLNFNWFFNGTETIQDAIDWINTNVPSFPVTLTSGNGAQVPNNGEVIAFNGTNAAATFGAGIVKISTSGVFDSTFNTNTGTGSSTGAETILLVGSNYYFGNYYSAGDDFDGNTDYGPLAKISDAGVYDTWIFPIGTNDSWTAPAGVTQIGLRSYYNFGSEVFADVTPNTTYTIVDSNPCTFAGIRYADSGNDPVYIWWME